MRSLMSTRQARVACAVAIILVTGCHKKPLTFEPGAVKTLDAYEYDLSGQPKATKLSSDDATKIEALLAVLRKGEPAADHKCANDGHITLRKRDGGEIKIGILAGHDARYYEFRVYRGESEGYDMFRAERKPFLKAMAALGLDKLNPGGPE